MMIKLFKKIGISILNIIEFHIAPIFLALLFLSMVFQVILRYVFNYPSPELFEISQYSFIWVIFLGAPLARRFGSHIRFNILYEKFPRRVQLIFDLIFDSFFSIVLIITFFPIWDDILFYKFIRSNVLKIPWTYLLLCFPIFMILMFIHNLIWIYKNGRELFTEKKPDKEVEPWD
jgi:TRAP-type C4-dicarboxylate transport system permease small subunit